MIERISPTGFKTYLKSPDEYYLTYLSGKTRVNNTTQAMAIGSAFDAFIKSHLHKLLVGTPRPEYELTTLFEEQVEPEFRAWAWPRGEELLKHYINSGAVSDLLLDLNGALDEPRFETELKLKVGNATILGYPDLFFLSKNGVPVILDWKVNGYMSARPPSPEPGYVRVLPKRVAHPDCQVFNYKGIVVNNNYDLQFDRELNTLRSRSWYTKFEWAIQLTMYAWLCGVEPGGEVIVGIDQLLGKERIAQHRYLPSTKFQLDMFRALNECWDIINSDHYFRELSFEESQSRCELLKLETNDEWNQMMGI
jgi:hypothetical protein